VLERCGGLYSPLRESSRWGVRNLDMSGLGSDMSGKPLWKLARGPDMSGPGLCHRGIRLGQTCLGYKPDMSKKCL
jgi:hypothetical protein